jgi:hypothetical protein
MPDDLQRIVVWKNLPLNGVEHCALWHTSEGWRLAGTVIGVLEDRRPILATFDIRCDQAWHTRAVHVERTIAADVLSVDLDIASPGMWRTSGRQLHELVGCDDIDLSITPATNTLPIRRLNLAVGSSQVVVAAWMRFPDLTLQPLSQRYTRLATDIYRYESDTGFSAELTVDDLGLVSHYSGAWERIGTS